MTVRVERETQRAWWATTEQQPTDIRRVQPFDRISQRQWAFKDVKARLAKG